jgi:polar amino acid transport system permease protein
VKTLNKLLNNQIISTIAALSVYGLLVALIIYLYPGKDNFQLNLILDQSDKIFEGWLLTLFISVVVLFFSIFSGFSLYLLMISKNLFLNKVGSIFNYVVFGSPLIVFLLTIYYFLAVPLGFEDRNIIGIIALTLYIGPYMKNVFESALSSIDELQYQAMKVFGFKTWQKYVYIIIPQLIRILIPPMISNLTFIIKGSSLLYFIGVYEVYKQIATIQSNTYAIVEGYLVLFIVYLIITIPLIALAKYFEKKVSAWN